MYQKYERAKSTFYLLLRKSLIIKDGSLITRVKKDIKKTWNILIYFF